MLYLSGVSTSNTFIASLSGTVALVINHRVIIASADRTHFNGLLYFSIFIIAPASSCVAWCRFRSHTKKSTSMIAIMWFSSCSTAALAVPPCVRDALDKRGTVSTSQTPSSLRRNRTPATSPRRRQGCPRAAAVPRAQTSRVTGGPVTTDRQKVAALPLPLPSQSHTEPCA